MSRPGSLSTRKREPLLALEAGEVGEEVALDDVLHGARELLLSHDPALLVRQRPRRGRRHGLHRPVRLPGPARREHVVGRRVRQPPQWRGCWLHGNGRSGGRESESETTEPQTTALNLQSVCTTRYSLYEEYSVQGRVSGHDLTHEHTLHSEASV